MWKVTEMSKAVTQLLVLTLLMIGANTRAYAGLEDNLGLINLPPGFSISLYARVSGARSLAVVPQMDAVLVGSRGDTIHIIRDRGLKGRPQSVSPFMSGLKVPNGIAVKDGLVFIAEQHRIITVPLTGKKKERVLLSGLPDNDWHGWRYAAFGPNGKLFVAVGAPCNVCRVSGMKGTIIEVDAVTGKNRIFAKGVRNSVGMDFHPRSGQLYFTDNGSDGLGDEIPPDELNHAPRAGLHFGFPWYGGGTVETGEFPGQKPPDGAISPIVGFRAHAAALGIRFYRGNQFPDAYRNSAFVAQHGSWNRTTPIGYRIMHLKFDKSGHFLEKKIFADGWLQRGQKWGRPVDVKELPDGSLLVSDDHAGAVYRITYRP